MKQIYKYKMNDIYFYNIAFSTTFYCFQTPPRMEKKIDKLEVWSILSSKKSKPRFLSFLYKSILIIIHIIGQKNVRG